MNLSAYIDHTILKADCSTEDVQRLCAEAESNDFFAVCIPPYFVHPAKRQLENTSVKVATVIGFPMGYSGTAAKVEEIKRAIDEGVDELDVVINVCAVKSGNWSYVQNDIDAATRSAHLKGKVVKIILETSLLSSAELEKLVDTCIKVEPDFIKTSTGFNGGGATVEIVRKLSLLTDGKLKIKASGGIRNQADAWALIEAGAQRLGTSSSLQLIGTH